MGIIIIFWFSLTALKWAALGQQMGWVAGSKEWLAEEDTNRREKGKGRGISAEGKKTEELREPSRSCWWRGNLQSGSRGGEQERKRSEDPLTLIPLGSGKILIYFASPCFELFSSVFSHLRIPLTFGDH